MNAIHRLIERTGLARKIIPLLLVAVAAANAPADAIDLANGSFLPLGASNTSLITGDLLIAGQGASVEFWDISDPAAPQRITWRRVRGVVSEMVLKDDILWVSSWNGMLTSFDISNPQLPLTRADGSFSDYYGELAIVGDWLVGVDFTRNRIFRLDATNPYQTHSNDYITGTIGIGIVPIDDTTAWVSGSAGVRRVDFENLTIDAPVLNSTAAHAFPLGPDHLLVGTTVYETSAMNLVTTIPVASGVHRTWVDGTTGWILEDDYRLQRVDLSDPTAPVVTGSTLLPLSFGPGRDLYATGDLVAVSSDTRTVLVRRTAVSGGDDIFETTLVTQGGYVGSARATGRGAVFAAGDAGLVIGDVDAGWQTLPLSSGRDFFEEDLLLEMFLDIWRLGVLIYRPDPAVPAAPGQGAFDETILYGARGTAGIEIFEYDFRDRLASLGTRAIGNDIRGVTLRRELLFALDASQGVHILDASDRRDPVAVGLAPVTWANECVAKGDYLYVAGGSGSLIFDISDPADPQQVATFPAATTIAVKRGRLYVGEPFQITVWDVSDPTSPSLAGTIWQYAGARSITPVRGPNGEHLVWLALGFQGVAAVDMTDPEAIVILETWQSWDIAEGVIPFRDKVYVADGAAGIHALRDRDAEMGPEASPPTDAPRAALPADLRLTNSPNPVRGHTDVRFQLTRDERVTLEVYDVAGRRVATLLDRALAPGSHSARWDGRDATGRRVAAGVYLYRLATPTVRETRKMIVVP